MRKILDVILVNLLIVLMSVMVMSTLLQVAARLMSFSFPYTEEITVYAMMWVTLFGSAYAFGLRKHIAIDVLSNQLSVVNRYKLEMVVESIIILFSVFILIIGGSRFVYITFKLGQTSSVIQIPKGWIYLALPISGLVIILYNIQNILDIYMKQNGNESD
jgi:TRAP-type C4-dicarboxylate transport system permease small subunit